MAIRYTTAALLFTLALLYFLGGYLPARRRLAKNLPPLRYHRWMVMSSHRRINHPHNPYNAQNSAAYMQRYGNYQSPFQQQQQQQGYGGQGYMMNEYAPPPPAYHSSEVPPPVYAPPEGGSKVLADQQGFGRQQGFERVGLGAGQAGRS